MSVKKVYECDVCGKPVPREDLVRFGVRNLDDRPEDADNIDVCTYDRREPISDVIDVWQRMRKEAGNAD